MNRESSQSSSFEYGSQFLVQARVGQDENLVAWPQPQVPGDGSELAVSHHEADPRVAGKTSDLTDGVAVGGCATSRAGSTTSPSRRAQPDPQGPGLRFDGPHLHAQQPGGRRYQAALHDNGEHDDHGDDAVKALGLWQVGL
jgi:hypothetical protein